MTYRDRSDAGRRLAAALHAWRGADAVVVGLPRGGVLVAFEVAELLDAPLDLLPARKLGAPMCPEYAIGAVAPGVCVLEERVVEQLGIPREVVAREIASRLFDLEQMERRYAPERPGLDLAGRTVILVDDGLATGATACAGVEALRRVGAARVVVAAPVGGPPAVAALTERADAVVCPRTPDEFQAVGDYYDDFSPVGDEEVVRCLRRASERGAASSHAGTERHSSSGDHGV